MVWDGGDTLRFVLLRPVIQVRFQRSCSMRCTVSCCVHARCGARVSYKVVGAITYRRSCLVTVCSPAFALTLMWVPCYFLNSETTFLTKQPDCIKFGTMRHYQLEGLNWMVRLNENGINGEVS